MLMRKSSSLKASIRSSGEGFAQQFQLQEDPLQCGDVCIHQRFSLDLSPAVERGA